jgi:DNA-3-methyladenine glycosylase II
VTRPLTARGFARAVSVLTGRDRDLAAIVARHGRPRFWRRPPGFATLALIVLEQQVSLASARATFGRLQARLGTVTPEGLLELDHAALRADGVSRQKARYCRALAGAVLGGSLPLDRLGQAPDDEARGHLEAVVGIGRWTADVYLLSALGRRDVWPVGDLALVRAVQRIKGLDDRPTADEMMTIGEDWRPWRAVAARLLWHEYLSGR